MEYTRRYHKHIRLRGNDYTQGTYFVTLCTDPRRELFGPIVENGVDARIDLNDLGRIVHECWRATPDHFPHARLDQTQIMPDHLHSILVLNGSGSTQWVDATGATRTVGAKPRGPVPGSLGAIIGAFKSVTTKQINAALGRTRGSVWQDGYHERAIRRQGDEYGRIAQYIAENPAKWR